MSVAKNRANFASQKGLGRGARRKKKSSRDEIRYWTRRDEVIDPITMDRHNLYGYSPNHGTFCKEFPAFICNLHETVKKSGSWSVFWSPNDRVLFGVLFTLFFYSLILKQPVLEVSPNDRTFWCPFYYLLQFRFFVVSAIMASAMAFAPSAMRSSR